MLNNSKLLILPSVEKGAIKKPHKSLIPWVYGHLMYQVHKNFDS